MAHQIENLVTVFIKELVQTTTLKIVQQIMIIVQWTVVCSEKIEQENVLRGKKVSKRICEYSIIIKTC
jgi:hypothetical protein